MFSNNNAGCSRARHDPSQSKGWTPTSKIALYEEKLKEDDWGHQHC